MSVRRAAGRLKPGGGGKAKRRAKLESNQLTQETLEGQIGETERKRATMVIRGGPIRRKVIFLPSEGKSR